MVSAVLPLALVQAPGHVEQGAARLVSYGRSRVTAMEAQTWTVIGLLTATIFGALFYLGSRIDAVGARFDSRIDGLTSEVRSQGARIDTLGSRIDALGARFDSRIDGLTSEVRAHGARIDALGERLDSRIDGLTGKLDEHLKHHAG